MGSQAGTANTTGTANTFIGYQTGNLNVTSSDNVFVGAQAGMNNTGSGNTFIGMNAGATNTTGNDNIFIGNESANLSTYQTLNNRFVVGNNTKKDWIIGTIGSDAITINGNQVCLKGVPSGSTGDCALSSSRVYKKNIKAFKDFEKSLKNILSTPLFTYQYKKNHSEKSRMGVISEELPESLQIKVKGAPSLPDWPSVYGTLWGGVKALNQRLSDFKIGILNKMAEEKHLFSKDIIHFKKEFSLKFENQMEGTELTFKSVKNDWDNRFSGELKGQLKVFKNELSHFKSWFKEVEDRLNKMTGLKEKMGLSKELLVDYKKHRKDQKKQLLSEQERLEKTEKSLLQAKERLKKKKEVLAEAEKRLSETKKQLLKIWMEDKEKFEIYDKKLKQLEGKLKTFTVSGSS